VSVRASHDDRFGVLTDAIVAEHHNVDVPRRDLEGSPQPGYLGVTLRPRHNLDAAAQAQTDGPPRPAAQVDKGRE
jgi:hypothetical protein